MATSTLSPKGMAVLAEALEGPIDEYDTAAEKLLKGHDDYVTETEQELQKRQAALAARKAEIVQKAANATKASQLRTAIAAGQQRGIEQELKEIDEQLTQLYPPTPVVTPTPPPPAPADPAPAPAPDPAATTQQPPVVAYRPAPADPDPAPAPQGTRESILRRIFLPPKGDGDSSHKYI